MLPTTASLFRHALIYVPGRWSDWSRGLLECQSLLASWRLYCLGRHGDGMPLALLAARSMPTGGRQREKPSPASMRPPTCDDGMIKKPTVWRKYQGHTLPWFGILRADAWMHFSWRSRATRAGGRYRSLTMPHGVDDASRECRGSHWRFRRR